MSRRARHRQQWSGHGWAKGRHVARGAHAQGGGGAGGGYAADGGGRMADPGRPHGSSAWIYGT
eukprot:6500275-Prymnesium_polylepis.1